MKRAIEIYKELVSESLFDAQQNLMFRLLKNKLAISPDLLTEERNQTLTTGVSNIFFPSWVNCKFSSDILKDDGFFNWIDEQYSTIFDSEEYRINLLKTELSGLIYMVTKVAYIDKLLQSVKETTRSNQKTFAGLLVCDADKKESIIKKAKEKITGEKPRHIFHLLQALYRLGYLPHFLDDRERAGIYRAFYDEFGYKPNYAALEKGINYYFQDGSTNEKLVSEYMDLLG